MTEECKGCKTANDGTLSVVLPGGWSVKHYEGKEGFFGWLALQTVKHRYTLADLREAEAKALGPNLRRLEGGIYKYWKNTRGQRVERVYVMYFLESQLERGHKWHFHIHLVPRFHVLKPLMRKRHKREIDAYRIAKLYRKLPRFLDRRGFENRHGKAGRCKEELSIVRGVVKEAGFRTGSAA